MSGRWNRFAGALAVTIVLLLGGAGAACAAEVIHSFDQTVQLAKDGTLTVTETLRVQAEGHQIKHGIFRDFPMTFIDAGGRERNVDFQLLDVTRDGKPEPSFTERQQRFIRIYAGAKDVWVTRGEHTYVFRYTTGRQVHWFEGKPELNWNVTGNFWNFPIETVRYRLTLAGGARPLHFTAFTGRLGARGTDWTGTVGSDGVLTVATTRALSPGEGLTVVAALPDAAVDPLTEQQAFWYAVKDNRHWITSGIGFLIVLIYYVMAWRAVGRDPRKGIVIPLFHPPQGVSPALANYIDNWGFGRDKWRAFTAAALSLAVRGLISFDQDGKRLTLKQKAGAAPSGPLPSGEQAIYTWVKTKGDDAIIDKAHGVSVASVAAKFTAAIEGESKGKFFRRNLGYAIAGLAMTIVAVVGVLTVGGLQDEDINALVMTLFGSFFLGVFVLPLLLGLFTSLSLRTALRSLMSVSFLAVFITFFFALTTMIVPEEPMTLPPAVLSFIESYPFSFVLVAAFAGLNGLFFYLLRAPTALGRPVMDQLAGLRLYLETAETDRMNLAGVPDMTAAHFEALLPYAVALKVEKPWSETFAAALARAHPGAADPMQYYQPTWTGQRGDWSGPGFGTAVAAAVGGMSSAMASAMPVSSGSSGFSSGGGGGGGSGGGGGGGGGGGW